MFKNKMEKISENCNILFEIKKWIKIILFVVGFAIVLFVFFKFFEYILEEESDVIVLITFIGGLFGSLIIKICRDIYKLPLLIIETWANINSCIWNSGDHIHYKIRITNQSRFFAKKCQIKISLVYNKDDIVPYTLSIDGDWGTTMHKNDKEPFIKNTHEYSEITDEHILWDFQPYGKQELTVDIPPKSSYFATIARYYVNSDFNEGKPVNQIDRFSYFKVLSENQDIPRVYLNYSKKYKIEIKVLGENFMPKTKKVILEKT